MTTAALVGALVIVLLRIADVALGTLRIAMLVRGRRGLAGILSFAEALVWLLAAAQVLTNLDSPIQFVAYAGGYALGTVLGVSLERWIAIGDTLLRVVAPVDSERSATALRDAGFVVTELNARGRDGDMRVSLTVIPRRRMKDALRIVEEANPEAFVTFESTTPIRSAAAPTRWTGNPFPPARVRK